MIFRYRQCENCGKMVPKLLPKRIKTDDPRSKIIFELCAECYSKIETLEKPILIPLTPVPATTYRIKSPRDYKPEPEIILKPPAKKARKSVKDK